MHDDSASLGATGSSQPWGPLIGTWAIAATHRLLPDEPIAGTAEVAWLDQQRFLLVRWHFEHPKVPDALAVIGDLDGAPAMHYFDVRGVHRTFDVGIDGDTWWYRNEVPGFSQRFTGTFGADGRVMEAVVELCTDGTTWERDMLITYTKT